MDYGNVQAVQVLARAQVPQVRSDLEGAAGTGRFMIAQANDTPMPSGKIRFEIAPQPAASALIEFGRQADVTILVDSAAREIQVPGLHGAYDLEEGLALILKGTELHYRINHDSIFVSRGTGGAGANSTRASASEQHGGSANGSRFTDPDTTPKKRGLLAALIAAVLGTAGGNADADQASEAESRSTRLDEIVVTAQKRKERLIDVPQSVMALSADQLTTVGALQFRDWAHSVPGLNFTTAGAGDLAVWIRGVTPGPGPTVGIYVDEVPYGSSSSLSFGPRLAFDSALFDLERIEVLRGPQGTYYGASSMGGVIKYVTNAPSTEGHSGRVQTGLGSTNEGRLNYNGAATVNVPIATDRAALRLTGFYSRDGGYIDSVALDEEDVNQSEVYGGRADLLWTPNDELSFRLTGFVQNIDRDGQGTTDYTFDGGHPFGSLGQSRPTAEPFEQRFRLVSGTVVYDLDWAALTSITSYQEGQTDFREDLEAFRSFAEFLFGRTYSGIGFLNSGPTDKFTQEVRLASEGSRPLEWVIGGFYTRETTRVDQRALLFDLDGTLTADDLFTIESPSRFDEYAGFGTLTWYLTDKLDISGGIRYAHNREKTTQNASGLLAAPRPTARSDEDVTTYLANARYHFSDQATGYLRYATGYRPGGPNYLILDPATGLPAGPLSFESDRLKSYEVGFKAVTGDGRFGIDLATFHNDWDNIIIFTGVGRGNAPGGARIRGVELSLTARPVDAFTLLGALAYLDAEMKEAEPILGAAEGERLPNVPRLSAAVNADYELSWIGRLQPTIGITAQYVDDRNASFGGSGTLPQYRLPDYTTVDLRAGFTLGRVDAQLYLRNLLDERGQLSVRTDLGPRPAILQPRTIGITLTISF